VIRRPTVYLFRGIFDVYSFGMDDLANKLRARGIEASVYSHTNWQAVSESIVARHGIGRGDPIVLIGHSLGGGAAIALAVSLGRAGIPVDLVVPVDPVGPPPVTANVRQVVNYYQSNNGFGQPVGTTADFRGRLMNADVESNRRDLRGAGLTHTTIDKSPSIHAEIIRQVLSLGRAQPR
jgi:pimeloyl-ACP methyl ester carboxylesterase